MSKFKWIISICGLVVVVCFIITIIAGTAPKNYPNGYSLRITSGSTISEVATILADDGLIRSKLLFRIYTTLLDHTTGIKTGEYLFDKSESVLSVAKRLVKGLEGYPVIKVTIPEGNDYRGVADIIHRAIPSFDKKSFLPLAKANEGYMFPDTYFWPTNLSPERALEDMKKLFAEKTKPLDSSIANSGRTLKEIITMASIVEREAAKSSDRKIVAGILWKRLKLGMPLQADATFYYVIGTTTRALTYDDLRMDSAYNLYTHAGLPPTPIANPGLETIMDTINITKTPFFYYLSDKKGQMHYSETLEGHNINKYKYL